MITWQPTRIKVISIVFHVFLETTVTSTCQIHCYYCRDAVVITTAKKLKPKLNSAKIQTLLAVCWKFPTMRATDNSPGFQPRPLSATLITANFQQAASWIWTYVELCSVYIKWLNVFHCFSFRTFLRWWEPLTMVSGGIKGRIFLASQPFRKSNPALSSLLFNA